MQHPQARRLDFQRPRHILYVGTTTDAKQQLHLMTTSEDNFDHSARYIALSHCWGKEGVSIKTTKANLHLHQSSIPMSSLPNTFRDAVIIARGLGVSYLWIDSLCIPQDDDDIWKSEASKMGAIFHYAYLTISAAAQNCHGGCGVSSVDPPASHFLLPDSANSDITNPGQVLPLGRGRKSGLHIRDSSNYKRLDLYTESKDWPLNHRGWIFQEILLSRRVLHINPQGMLLWQCHSLLESESGGVRVTHQLSMGLPASISLTATFLDAPLRDFRDLADSEKQPSIWWKLLRLFFHRSFTYPRDDVPALLATLLLFQSLTGDTPVVGLWRKHLHADLQWRWDQYESYDPLPGWPSWSWLSVGHSMRRHLKAPPERRDVVWSAEVGDICVEWEGTPFVSRLNTSTIQVKRYQADASKPMHASVDWDPAIDAMLGEQPDVPWPPLGFWPAKSHSSGIVYLPLQITASEMDDSRRNIVIAIHGLCLKQTDCGQYRRVGLVYHHILYWEESLEAAKEDFFSWFKFVDTVTLV